MGMGIWEVGRLWAGLRNKDCFLYIFTELMLSISYLIFV
jgi:hypothetical protein